MYVHPGYLQDQTQRASQQPGGGMNSEWIRDNVRSALGFIYITGNGQLGDLASRPVITTSRYRSNPPRYVIVEGRKVRRHAFPLKISQTLPKGTSHPLINEYDYHLVPWRRAINSIVEPFQAWLLYCYGDYRYHRKQLNVVPHIWEMFLSRLSDRRISGKVKQRLQALAWLAVQVVASEIKGYGREYSYAELGGMVGVTKQNWNNNYQESWEQLISIVCEIDAMALYKLDRQRREILAMQREALIVTY
ncbi:antitermination protein [Salmonella enterica subsp. enterica]|nr:antitermination protein [Salmonella enterica subsp. enterica serovar Louisiana]EBW7767041.1 antitermination protein [Salmonella enterica subsp. enterica serovar Louisiana]ECD3926728.1 antitermination protein [Salmonella enterica subsp. enterica serovar Wangata]EDT9665067.1 antitermination protein [Salmonella enterica subsp. enterica serovar Louisiana]